MLLHFRLSHPNFLYLRRLFPSLFHNNEQFSCEICQFPKHKRIPFSPRLYQPSNPFALVHNDLWGPSRVYTPHNQNWFVTFTNDHTRVSRVYLLKEKSDVTKLLKIYIL